MRVAVYCDGLTPAGWVVEAINEAEDGGIDMASFTGAVAEARAREYAAWKYPGCRGLEAAA